ncbi:MAG: NAD(P)/FAD-dependent oxidoreductase, partial [Zoogloeaceae bacterium]|nr:NAD(P)/FAD-dependent oxidoreductase [Zoogloeaceae bacterium]
MSAERESMEYDVVIVGAGPSGLAAAIRLKQLAAEKGGELSVCLLEKGSEVGAHLLSGACLDPCSLAELIPDYMEKGAPLNVPASEDIALFMTPTKAIRIMTPPQMNNEGNYVISEANLCRWLGKLAEEEYEVEIYAGFPAAKVLYGDDGSVIGVQTGDMGIGKDGEPTDNYAPGMNILAKQTIFAEGCRGSLTRELWDTFDLRKGCDPQTYGIGIKEIWEVQPEKHKPGLVQHTVGWPLDTETYGGTALYHMD